MRRIITVCCCLLAVLMCDAQKKEISQARTYIKNGKDKDLSSAEKLMTDLLAKDSANRQNPRIYATWYDAALLQYESANEKLYLKQKYDTVQFFSLIRKLYQLQSARFRSLPSACNWPFLNHFCFRCAVVKVRL